ncbi:FAD-dependent oxidoreductase [Nocardiopsis coralliicola]
MRVLIIGAGLGGLALAHGLQARGIGAAVHDRDPEAAATGGYRVHLDEHACAVLRGALAPEHYQALLASSAPPQSARRFSVADHRLRLLFADDEDPLAERLMIGRIPLRRLLARGLGGAVRWGSRYTEHAVAADGTVTAHFADGSSDHGDLLVGADGARSRVAEQLAGRRLAARLGVQAVTGRTPLDARTRPLVPGLLSGGPALAFGPGGIGLFLTVHDPAAGAPIDPSACTAFPAESEPPALIWGTMAPDRAMPDRDQGAAPEDLIGTAAALLGGWHPDLLQLVAAADPVTTAHFAFHAADPAADLTPWAAGPATALGDAVHAMPPTGGQGAATAIRDAGALAGELAAAAGGSATIPLAVHRYQRTMAAYAAPAVRMSLGPLGWLNRLATPIGARASRIGLPAAATAARLHRRLAGVRGG